VSPAPDTAVVPPTVELAHVRVDRDGEHVLHDLSLVVPAGGRLALLGPSGAGKSTVLRVVAGLDPLVAGHVRFDGDDVTRWPPRARQVAMVTQDATLQPHLSVRGNLRFPLRLRRVPPEEEAARILAEARAFSLLELLERRPRTLAAGRRHEVALAQAMVRRTGVLLADEPFGLVDAGRRAQLQQQLLALQEGAGFTLLLATNDQRTAMTMGQQLAVLRAGRLEQLGDPMTVHDRPASAFVAGFVGDPPMSLVPAVWQHHAGTSTLRAGPLRARVRPVVRREVGERAVLVGVRPSAWRLATANDDAAVTAHGRVERVAFLGAEVEAVLRGGDGGELRVVLPRPGPGRGDRVRLATRPREVHLFDAAGGEALRHGV
jgi:multiple sugar transport system ATP-binding protein